MERELKLTADGSATLYVKALGETYHSTHGAWQEARHVFIENGLNHIKNYEINIIELGLGTGLNVLATIDEFLKNESPQKINYYGIEKYPVTIEESKVLNYSNLTPNATEIMDKIHTTEWEEPVEIVPNFFLTKHKKDFYDMPALGLPAADLVYFDCFGARVQPDLWEIPLLEMISEKMKPYGLLTTYASKGSFRRALQSLGFEVKKVPGPVGKREMTNAWKIG